MRNDPPLVPMKTVVHLTSLSRATIYRRIADKRFPPKVELGGRRIASTRTNSTAGSPTRTSTTRRLLPFANRIRAVVRGAAAARDKPVRHRIGGRRRSESTKCVTKLRHAGS